MERENNLRLTTTSRIISNMTEYTKAPCWVCVCTSQHNPTYYCCPIRFQVKWKMYLFDFYARWFFFLLIGFLVNIISSRKLPNWNKSDLYLIWNPTEMINYIDDIYRIPDFTTEIFFCSQKCFHLCFVRFVNSLKNSKVSFRKIFFFFGIFQICILLKQGVVLQNLNEKLFSNKL